MISQTLDWINNERNLHGLPPLQDICKGIRKSRCDCPIANSLKFGTKFYVQVSILFYNFVTFKRKRLPDCCFGFIRQFDAGELPEYDISNSQIY